MNYDLRDLDSNPVEFDRIRNTFKYGEYAIINRPLIYYTALLIKGE